MQQAVGPLAVGERRLERIGALRQPILNDRLHAHLAERAARLLIGEDLLQAHHVARELGQVLLRGVDDRQSFVELRDRLVRLARRLVEIGADLMGHAVEPLIDRPRQLAVAGHADLGQRLKPHLQFTELDVAGRRFAPPPAHMHHEHDGEHHEREHGEARQHEPDNHGIERNAPHLQGLKGHDKNVYADSFF